MPGVPVRGDRSANEGEGKESVDTRQATFKPRWRMRARGFTPNGGHRWGGLLKSF